MTRSYSAKVRFTGRRLGAAVVTATTCAALLAGCTATPVAASVRTLPAGSGPVPALADAGSRRDIESVRRAAARALTVGLHVFDVDAHGRPLLSAPERTRLVQATTTGSERTRLQEALARSLAGAPSRRGGRFVVEHWDGVQVVGDHARAFVSGHSGYTPTAVDPQRRDGTSQYQLLLTRTGDEWKVDDLQAASNEQG